MTNKYGYFSFEGFGSSGGNRRKKEERRGVEAGRVVELIGFGRGDGQRWDSVSAHGRMLFTPAWRGPLPAACVFHSIGTRCFMCFCWFWFCFYFVLEKRTLKLGYKGCDRRGILRSYLRNVLRFLLPRRHIAAG